MVMLEEGHEDIYVYLFLLQIVMSTSSLTLGQLNLSRMEISSSL